MSQAIERAETRSLSPSEHFTSEQQQVLKRTVAKGATNDEFYMFASLCARYDLDPFNREIWFIKYGGDPIILTSRDGYLKICQRDPDFMGINSATVREGDHFEIQPAEGMVIHRFGAKRGRILGAWAMAKHRRRDPVITWAEFSEYDTGRDTWKKYPSAMICKVAEVMALKRQGGIAGLVTREEMGVTEGDLSEGDFRPSIPAPIPQGGASQQTGRPDPAAAPAPAEDPALTELRGQVKTLAQQVFTGPDAGSRMAFWLTREFKVNQIKLLDADQCRTAVGLLEEWGCEEGIIDADFEPDPREEELEQGLDQALASDRRDPFAEEAGAEGQGEAEGPTERERRLIHIEEMIETAWPNPAGRTEGLAYFIRTKKLPQTGYTLYSDEDLTRLEGWLEDHLAQGESN